MSRRSVGMAGCARVVLCITLIILAAGFVAFVRGVASKPGGPIVWLKTSSVTIDLSRGDYRVSPAVASGPEGEDFDSIVHRLKPYAAICGTYYDEEMRPQGDLVADGKIIHRGYQRQGIGFTSDGRIVFRERRGRLRMNWRGCSAGIAGGPRLLRDGKPDIHVERDGFKPAAARIKAMRCAVGATADGKLIMCVVSQPVTLSTMAEVMQALGAKDAINLDGGGSCALYEDGQIRVEPSRALSNVLAVYRK